MRCRHSNDTTRMETEIKKFIKEYSSEILDGNAAIFAGAGLSMSCGMSSWKELLKDIAEELKLDIDRENDLLSMLKAKYDKNPFIIAVHNYTDVMRTGSKEVVVEIKGNKLVVVDEKVYKATVEEELTEVVDNSFEANKDDILNKFAEETQESWDAKSEEIKSELIKQIKEGC